MEHLESNLLACKSSKVVVVPCLLPSHTNWLFLGGAEDFSLCRTAANRHALEAVRALEERFLVGISALTHHLSTEPHIVTSIFLLYGHKLTASLLLLCREDLVEGAVGHVKE